jgi:hypothetical protein
MESLKSEKNDYRVRNILAGFALLQMTEMQTAIAADLPTRDKTPEISETIQEQILSTLRIDDVEKFATVTDVIPSTLGKYIIQIDQLHMNSADPKKSETQTAKAQEEIGLLIDYLLKQKPNVKICPESLISVSEYESAKTDFNSLKERFLNAADDTEGLEILKKWIDTKKEKYTPQYVEKFSALHYMK